MHHHGFGHRWSKSGLIGMRKSVFKPVLAIESTMAGSYVFMVRTVMRESELFLIIKYRKLLDTGMIDRYH